MFGFEAINLGGSVIISPSNTHLAFVERGTISVLNNSVVDRPAVGSAAFMKPITSKEPPQVFVRLQSSRHSGLEAYMRIDGSPGNWTGFTMWASAFGGSTLPLYVLEFCVCANVSSAPASGFGMSVFDADGKPVFSSTDKLVKFSKFTKKWSITISGAAGGYAYFTFTPDIQIESDDFINISSVNKGTVNQYLYQAMFHSIRLYRNNERLLNLVTQGSYWYTVPGNVGNMRFCIPVCKFPAEIYHN